MTGTVLEQEDVTMGMMKNIVVMDAADRVVATAGMAGGIDEVRRIAAKGWPEAVVMVGRYDGTCVEVTSEDIRAAAQRVVDQVDGSEG